MNVTQRSLSGGELSPTLFPRTDTVKYAMALRQFRNAWTRIDGGSQNRPGFEFICEVGTMFAGEDAKVRLIPFDFGEITYIIEMTDERFSVIRDGALILMQTPGGANTQITGITQAAQGVLTLNASAIAVLTDGMQVLINGVRGMSELNNRRFMVSDHDNVGNTIKLKDLNGNYISTAALTAYASGGTITQIFQGSHPYKEDDLARVQFAQNTEYMIFTHPDYDMQQLTRTSETAWAFSEADLFAYPPHIAFNGVVGGAGSETYRYLFTAIYEDGSESPPCRMFNTNFAINGITNGATTVISVVNTSVIGFPDLEQDDKVFIESIVTGPRRLNGKYYNLVSVNAGTDDVEINEDSTGYPAWVAGGQVSLVSLTVPSAAVPTAAAPIGLTWGIQNSYSGRKIRAWNIYKEVSGLYGYIGTSEKNSFLDIGQEPDLASNPPEFVGLLDEWEDNPAVVQFAQERLMFANFDYNVERVISSQVGISKTFVKSRPSLSTDSLDFSIASKRIASIRHLLDVNGLLIFAKNGEFYAAGGDNKVITPSTAGAKQQSGYGSSYLPPIPVNSEALFVQEKGSIVRNINFSIGVDGYRGDDLTTFAKHLFKNKTLIDWTYQQVPNSLVWAARSDGVLLAMTYVPEQQIIAWHRHDVERGKLENVLSVSEGLEDKLYAVIKRGTKKYIGRMYTRIIDDIRDSVFMDLALSYDGRNYNDAHTMDLSGGTNWTNQEILTLTSSTAFFSAADVGNEVFLDQIDQDEYSPTYGEVIDQIRFKIISYSSSTVVTGRAHKTVPEDLRSALNTWSMAVSTVTGLHHLEGENVSVFADGYVVANPNNKKYKIATVENARVALPKCHAVIHVGIPITMDIETLDIDTPEGESLADRAKKVDAINIYLDETRGGFVGPRPPKDESEDFLGGLIEFKPRSTENLDDTPYLKTGTFEQKILPEWNSNGRVFIRQTDPLPMSILAIGPSGIFT